MHTNIRTNSDIDIKTRADKLGCNSDVEAAFIPLGLSEADSIDELSYFDSTITVEKLLKENEIELGRFVEYDQVQTTQYKSTEIFLGSLYLTYRFLKSNPEVVIKIIEVIDKHYSRMKVGAQVELTIVIEKESGETVHIDYKGPIDEISEITEDIDNVSDVEVLNE